MRERAYHLWAGVGARNASATRRLLQADASAEEPAPTDRCIRYWIRDEAWMARANRSMGETQGLSLAELQVRWLAVLQGQMDDVDQLLASAGGPWRTAGAARRPSPRHERTRRA
jgi:hypothetical protein